MPIKTKLLGLLAFVGGSLWLWFWEFIRSWIYERIQHMLTPHIEYLGNIAAQYGPPTVLAVIGLWLFLRPPQQPVAASRDVTVPLQGVAATSAVGNVQQAIDWLTPLAEKDDQEIEQRIHLLHANADTRAFLDATNPFFKLGVVFINASIFDLRLEKIDGYMTYYKDEVKERPKLVGEKGGDITERDRLLPHGTERTFLLRLYLTEAEAASVNRSVSVDDRDRGHYPLLKTGHSAIFFSYTNLSGENKTVRKAL